MNLIGSFVIAFSMYSRIPMPRMDWTEERMRYALCFFPLIGAVIGAVEIATFALCEILGAGVLFRTCLLTAVPLLITGGIHMDGYLDVTDARHSYGEREKKLAILKDPHTGAFAIIGLGLYLLLYAGAVSELVGADVWLLPGALMLERACSGYSVVAFPKAKKDGLAAEFSRSAETKVVRVSMAVLAVLAISWMIYWGHLRGALAALTALATFVCYYRFHAGIWRHQRRSGRHFSAELRAECGAGAGGDAAGRYVPAVFEFLSEEKQNDFYNWRQEQGKTAYAMKLWEKRTLERRKTKDLSTVLNRSKNPEACRVTARIADGRLETDEQTILQADLITHFELFVRREMEAGRDPYVFAERLMQENPGAFVTADEIGCGIVPMEAFERDYRETDGRICQRIAAYSEEVHRVICGLGMRIK
ncbi:MAG: adenosylcobinamide-GDP ribazoletransferase [Clostridium fessum]